MLERLQIENYVLIESLNINFHSGFSVITGETGAGKSILLGALGLLLGNKAETKVIKKGKQKCMVEARFLLENNADIAAFFERADLDFDGKECIVRREVSASGKSRAFVNDTPVNVSTLKELGDLLIDIHSQHKNLLLNESAFKIRILDLVAQNQALTEKYKTVYRQVKDVEKQIEAFSAKLESARKEQDYMQFQYNQLSECHLVEGEQEELEKESSMLSHVEEIKQLYFEINDTLNGNTLGLLDGLKTCCSHLERLQRIDVQAEELYGRMENLYVELKDIAREIVSNAEAVDYDPRRLEEVEARLNTLYDLQRKHHVSGVAELLDIQHKLAQELQNLEVGDEELLRLKEKEKDLMQSLRAIAAELSEKRKKAALVIEKKMTDHLQSLGMPHVQFRFQFEEMPVPELHGWDKVTILFSNNKNAPLQDLSQIASGGEIARVMLSLKALIAQNMLMPTLIFDEIDTGVSGNIAEKMAFLMKEIAKGNKQVISITHLPQIAATGTHHYRVYKQDNEEQTISHITELKPDERVEEIAHMLSGSALTQAAITNAKELLKQSLSQ